MTVSVVPLRAGFGAAGFATTCEAGADCVAGDAAAATGEPAGAAPTGEAAGAAATGLLSAGFAASAGLVSAGFVSAGGETGLEGRQAASRVAAPPSAASERKRRRVRAPVAKRAIPPVCKARGSIGHLSIESGPTHLTSVRRGSGVGRRT